MSADNWAQCPRCAQRGRAKIEATAAAVNAAYGTVPVDEFDEMRKRLNGDRVEFENRRPTFREDYDVSGAETGTVTVHYSGGCSLCGLRLSFTHSELLPDF